MQFSIFENLQWISSGPILTAHSHPGDIDVSIKDPSVVFHEGRWHVYATSYVLNRIAPHMVYVSFEKWEEADAAPRHWIDFDEAQHCAPQVFYFRPQQKWYLIYQRTDPATGLMGPVFSTLDDVSRPETITFPQAMFPGIPAPLPDDKWLDFWVICNEQSASLFFVDNRGAFYRCQTALDNFPFGWSNPAVVLSGSIYDLFEGSCTYRIKGTEKYLTLIEAVSTHDASRYYKAWLADSLDGEWTPISSEDKPFAGMKNVRFDPGAPAWTSSISHGELVRDGIDETLTIDPSNLSLLYQGNHAGDEVLTLPGEAPGYRHFRYKLGLLTAID